MYKISLFKKLWNLLWYFHLTIVIFKWQLLGTICHRMDTWKQNRTSTRTGRSLLISWALHSNNRGKRQWLFGWLAFKNLRAAELFGPLSPRQVWGGCAKGELIISICCSLPIRVTRRRPWRLVSEAETRDGIANWSELLTRYAPRRMHSAFLGGWGDAHDARNRWMGGGISVSAMGDGLNDDQCIHV